MKFDCEFLFAALAEKHNAIIRKIREIPPWEWGGEFLELEPQVLRFLGTFAKRYPECAAFKTAHTLASALAVYRLGSHKPRSADMQPDTQPTNQRNETSVTRQLLTFGVTSFYAYNILQNVVTGKLQRYYRYEIMQNVVD